MLRGLPGIKTKTIKDVQVSYGERDGTIIEKGVAVTQDKMLKWEGNVKNLLETYCAYPDIFVDEVLTPKDSNFKLMFMQRIFLRAIMRIPLVHITAARGFSKTFTALLGLILKGIFQPGSEMVLAAPVKAQAADIANQKINDILNRFPLLNNEISGRTSGKDYSTIRFKNGSLIEVTAPLDSTRGKRFAAFLCDEARDHDGDSINSIMIPTLVVSRRTIGKNILNPREPHQAQIYTTSASAKSSYNYGKLIELFEMSIMNPKKAMVFGFDYRVPVIEGLYTEESIRDMKLSSTFKEADFAREFLSIYTSDNEQSWFNFNQLNRHRKIVNAEWSPKLVKGLNQFYLLSIDVGRYHDQTVVTVFKVLIRKDNKYKVSVTNIYVLGRTAQTKRFEIQAKHIKKLIEIYDPKEVVIDTNGLGASIADFMVVEQSDEHGNILPAYGFINDDNYKLIQPLSARKILYGIKATAKLNSQMYSNCYSKIDSGAVDFLIREQEARNKLLATKKGQKMNIEAKTKRLMPYEMTTKLFEEMGNLRLKRTGAQDISLEQINARFPKDKFSSLTMGLWRIKELEDIETKKKRRRRNGDVRQAIFFTGG